MDEGASPTQVFFEERGLSVLDPEAAQPEYRRLIDEAKILSEELFWTLSEEDVTVEAVLSGTHRVGSGAY